MIVDIFVDKAPLTTQEACNDAISNKLPTQQAKNLLNKINHLYFHSKPREKFSNNFLST